VPAPPESGKGSGKSRTLLDELPVEDDPGVGPSGDCGAAPTPAAVPMFVDPIPGVVPSVPPGPITVPLNGPAGAPPTGGLASPAFPGAAALPGVPAGAVFCAKDAGVAAINAAAIAVMTDSRLSMRNLLEESNAPQDPCR
jgi:hypothetical protein